MTDPSFVHIPTPPRDDLMSRMGNAVAWLLVAIIGAAAVVTALAVLAGALKLFQWATS